MLQRAGDSAHPGEFVSEPEAVSRERRLMNGATIVQSVTPNLGGTASSPDATWSTQAKPTNFG
jgi:hypothetical protein